MEDDGRGENSSFIIAMIENRAKEVGVAAFDLRSASLHLSQHIETSSSYQNTRTLLLFYDPIVIILPPNKLAPDGMIGVSVLVDKYYSATKKVMLRSFLKFCSSSILSLPRGMHESSMFGVG
ncbi:MutS protein msh4 [Dionaea muscipula]